MTRSSSTEHPRIGFETTGNATIIAYDSGPVLATDPWITDSAYFGSWGHTHEIPASQLAAIKAAKNVWFSHGHPDHLSGDSLPHFKGRRILLPDHAGGRIKRDLEAQGFDVQVLPDRIWVPLSDNVRVLCLADYNQDAILLIDVGGRLLVNLNDAGNRGWESFIQRTVAGYEKSFLLALSCYGDADMINFFEENGVRVLPAAAKRFPVGAATAKKAEAYGCRYVIPSSSMHQYRRSDSVWANEFTTPLSEVGRGYELEARRSELLPAFLRYDCEDDSHACLNPKPISGPPRDPKDFGDDWSDLLEAADFAKASRYFQAIDHLKVTLDSVVLRVGGKDNTIAMGRGTGRSISFEVPRGSLMTALDYAVFDDLLIGNFMKTTLHGRWPRSGLYPDFSPYVAKYADNGGARTRDELAAYFAEYRRRAPFLFLRHRLEERAKDVVRSYVAVDSPAFQRAKRLYWDMKRLI